MLDIARAPSIHAAFLAAWPSQDMVSAHGMATHFAITVRSYRVSHDCWYSKYRINPPPSLWYRINPPSSLFL
jgi:hypothetical protein